MCHAFSRAHVAIVEANTLQPVMFVVADWQRTTCRASMALGTKWLQNQIVSCCLVGVRFVQHRALPSPPAAPHVRSPRQRLPRAALLKARLGPPCQSGSCASRPRAQLRHLRFIGQADVSRTVERPSSTSRKQKTNASRSCQWHSDRSNLAIERQLSFSQSRHVCCRMSQSSNKRSQVCLV